MPDVVSVTDYSAFGAPLPGRQGTTSTGYRYGFNGKENDAETGTQDYGFRIYNPSLGKFLSVDPLAPEYPWYTPYQFAGDMPISMIDRDGLEPVAPMVAYAVPDAVLQEMKTNPSDPSYVGVFWNLFVSTTIAPLLEPHAAFNKSVEKATEMGTEGVVQYTLADNNLNDYSSRVDPMTNKIYNTVNKMQGAAKVAEAGVEVCKGAATTVAANMLVFGELMYVDIPVPNLFTKNALNQSITNKLRSDVQKNIGVGIYKYKSLPNIEMKGGLITQNGKPFNGAKVEYVIGEDGAFKLGVGHDFMTNNAASAKAAGRLTIKDGKIIYMDDWSGHFQPSATEMDNVFKFFKKEGVLDQKVISTWTVAPKN